jgi:hypothetical protein
MRSIGCSSGAVTRYGQSDGHGRGLWMADGAYSRGDGEAGRDVGRTHGPCWGWTGASLGDGRGDGREAGGADSLVNGCVYRCVGHSATWAGSDDDGGSDCVGSRWIGARFESIDCGV